MTTTISERAIVLRTTAIRESDLIVSLLFEQRGRISAFARGARRSKKRFMGGIDVFDCGKFELTLAKGPSQLPILASLTEREVWLGLRKNLCKFSLASYCLELVNTFATEGDNSSRCLFQPLHDCLKSLHSATSESCCYEISVYFNLILLQLEGVDPLQAQLQLSSGLRAWWEQILAEKQPLSAPTSAVLNTGFLTLLSFTEQTIGKQLNSRALLVG